MRSAPLRWRVGASYGHFESNLWFTDLQGASIAEDGVMAALEFRPGGRWTFQVSSGAVVGGALLVGGVRHALTPGWMHAAAVSVRMLDGTGYFPFVLLSATVSVSSTGTTGPTPADASARMISVDAGLVLTVGKTFFRMLSPYLMARVFGGPIFWHDAGRDVLGTDQYHFQLGAGVVLTLLRRLDLFVEGAPLGERRLSAGAGVAF